MRILLVTCFLLALQSEAQKAKKVIFLIGDGMGVSQIYAGLTANHGHLNLEKTQVVGFHKNQASNNYVTDSAAGATAFATGFQTYNSAIGVDSTKKPQVTLLELAEKKGLATGLVSTCDITDATPSSFIAHQIARSMHEEIAADFLKTDVDVVIGGGRKYFNKRKDQRNLVDELKAKNYEVVETLEAVNASKASKIFGLLAEENPIKISEGRGDQLLQSAKKAISILEKNDKGFFIMIEGSQIDWGGHANDKDYVTSEMIDFDKVIGWAFDYADKNPETLVVITADHETGGMALLGGDFKTGKVEAKFITGGHTGQMIPVFAYGNGASAFGGIYHNYDVFKKIKSFLKL